MSDSGAVTIGDVIADRYRIESVLGRGGLATVYRARDASLGRVVALKLLDSEGADATAIERGRSEIELLASLSHHALVTLFDAFEVDGRTVLVMQLIDGPDLGARLARGALQQADVVRMAIDLAEGLHAVHDRGIVHRDIKPGNVLLEPSSLPGVEFTAKLADFGIAYLIDSTRITVTGTVIGTAAFLSPEQARGAAPGAASDIYSLGLVLLESLTGKREFTGSLVESVAARLSRDPEVPSTLDDDWRALLTAMTAREPQNRPTALEVAIAARDIAVSQHVTTAPTLAFTAVMDEPTELIGEAPVLEVSDPTRVLDGGSEPTQVLNAGSEPTQALDAGLDPTSSLDAAATERIAPSAAPTATPATKRRWPLIAAAVAVVLIAGGIASVAASTGTPPVEPETAPTLPALDDPLGTDLADLLEAVSP